MKLINAINRIDLKTACEFIIKCKNIDGALGGLPEMESHAAYVFCGVGALAIANSLNLIDKVYFKKILNLKILLKCF